MRCSIDRIESMIPAPGVASETGFGTMGKLACIDGIVETQTCARERESYLIPRHRDQWQEMSIRWTMCRQEAPCSPLYGHSTHRLSPLKQSVLEERGEFPSN